MEIFFDGIAQKRKKRFLVKWNEFGSRRTIRLILQFTNALGCQEFTPYNQEVDWQLEVILSSAKYKQTPISH